MDAKQLQYFEAVCQEKSFAKAAEKLFISPQGLNKAIRKLENDLGVLLFERESTGLLLTDYGRILLSHCQSYLREHQHIINDIEARRRQSDMVLSIGVKTGFTQGFGPDFLLRFITENPDICVQLRSFSMPALKEAMEQPERSVWIIPGAYDHGLFSSVLEYRSPTFLIVGASHPLAQYDKISVQQLENYPLVALPHDIGQKSAVERALSDHLMPEPFYLLDIADREFTMHLIQSGMAISFNGNQDYLRYPGIKRIDFTDLDVTVEANVLIRRDAARSTALQRFLSHVENWKSESAEFPQ